MTEASTENLLHLHIYRAAKIQTLRQSLVYWEAFEPRTEFSCDFEFVQPDLEMKKYKIFISSHFGYPGLSRDPPKR